MRASSLHEGSAVNEIIACVSPIVDDATSVLFGFGVLVSLGKRRVTLHTVALQQERAPQCLLHEA